VKITGTNASENYYYPTYDYLGSLISLTDDQGSILEEYSYDAWGRMRKHDDWTYYVDETGLNYFDILGRGYTHHEHMSQYRLINMNGRVYDQILGQFIQPDNNVQLADHTLGYNRYNYVFNNPLSYTDPSGEEGILTAMIIAATVNTIINGVQNTESGKPFFHGAGWAAGTGAVQGALTFGVGEVAQGLHGINKIAFQTLAHGHIGGLSSVANGGKYSIGFVSGGTGSLAATGTGHLLRNQNQILQISGMIGSSALIAGGTSQLYGGNFWIGFRNGLISSATNHALHWAVSAIGFNPTYKKALALRGANPAAAKLSGQNRHRYAADAILYSGYFDTFGLGGTGIEYGILIVLRGDDAGVYSVFDSGVAAAGPSAGVGLETTFLYSSSDEVKLDQFVGDRLEFGASAKFGAVFGVNVIYAPHANNSTFTFGYASTIGVDIFPGFNAQINNGSTDVLDTLFHRKKK